MLQRLGELHKLRFTLQQSAEMLNSEAECEENSDTALRYLRLAVECKELDREIESVTAEILKNRKPDGTA
jgi:hypothetical protein